MEVIGMEEPNLETLIRDLYNNARQNLSEDLVLALVETAKQLPSTNERLLAVRLSGPGHSLNFSRIPRPQRQS